MIVTKVTGGITCGISGKKFERNAVKNASFTKIPNWITEKNSGQLYYRKVSKFDSLVRNCGLVTDQQALDSASSSTEIEEKFTSTTEPLVDGSDGVAIALAGSPSTAHSEHPNVLSELVMLSLPAIAGQTIEPLAQLMETAYIGRLGALQLASAGVSLSIINLGSKVLNIPLLSIATSFVAEDISMHENTDSTSDERKQLSSVSTALVLSVGIGIFEAAAMYFGSGIFLNLMGISADSPMRIPAEQFLKLRALGAPAVVLSLAIQGIFRGFKDTRTPVLCLGFGTLAAAILFPVLMFAFHLGVTGAAISTVASQYIVTLFMLWRLNERTVLQLPTMKHLQFGGYLKSGVFLLGRTLAAVLTLSLSTSMAARQGALAMAAHQICFQVWLSVSLLADAQAASGQALIASSFAKADFRRVKEITHVALQAGLFTGILLAVILGLTFPSLAKLFTSDPQVLDIVKSGILFVSASQPVNAVAYIFDGFLYGVSDFPYTASSMMIAAALSSAFMVFASAALGLSGVWLGLTTFMGLRIIAGYIRLSAKNGPWWFLHEESLNLKLSAENSS